MSALFAHADLLVLGLAIAAIAVLGFIILFNDPHSATHQAFFVFALSGILWGITNFAAYQAVTADQSLLLWRLVIFTATWFCYCIFRLANVFPSAEWPPQSLLSRILILPGVTLISLLTLTPLIFVGLAAPPIPGSVPVIVNGPLIPLFGFTVAALVIAAVYRFLANMKKEQGVSRMPVVLIMIGTTITFTFLITFNFILPTSFHNYEFIPYGGVFILPFVLCTAYAIGRYQILNIRLVAVELFSFTLVIATLIQILFSNSLFELLFRISSFLLVLALTILFIRSAIQEIKQREIIQKQEADLEIVNKQQENLLHFISHEIKGYLTKGQNAFASIVEGDYGKAPDGIQELSTAALYEMRKGVDTVMEILSASDLKKGVTTYKKAVFDFKEMTVKAVDSFKPAIEEKHLTIELQAAWELPCKVNGDEAMIRDHVVRNLIDNAIKYTPSGTIKVEVMRKDSIIRFAVEDSGVGITPEDMRRLFTEGGHGKDSVKINVHSTGYGLYIAKQVVEAHNGKIWAESKGAGTGSRFVVELPAV